MGGMSGADLTDPEPRARRRRWQPCAEGGQASLSALRISWRPRRYNRVRSVSRRFPTARPVIATTPIRVALRETDCIKVFYYADYLTYFEVARSSFLRKHGQAIRTSYQKVHMPVVEAVVRYHSRRSSTIFSRPSLPGRRAQARLLRYRTTGDYPRRRVASGSPCTRAGDHGDFLMDRRSRLAAALMPVASLPLPPAVYPSRSDESKVIISQALTPHHAIRYVSFSVAPG